MSSKIALEKGVCLLMKMITKEKEGYVLIFRPVKTLKNGRKLYAWQYGLKAWPIWIKVG